MVVDVFLFFFFEDLKREVLFLRIYGENYPQANTHVAVSSSFLVRACEGTSKSRIRAAKRKKKMRERAINSKKERNTAIKATLSRTIQKHITLLSMTRKMHA